MPDGDRFHVLIQRIRDRDPQAAQELVSEYEQAIRRVVRIHLRDSRLRRVLDSLDVCQSVLATFFVRTALGQYELETPDQLIRLLAVITRNKVANHVSHHRAERRDLRKDVPLDFGAMEVKSAKSDPGEQASARELLARVYDHFTTEEKYLAEQRSSGRSWPELAAELGASDVALRKKFSRAVDRVMAELGLDEHGND